MPDYNKEFKGAYQSDSFEDFKLALLVIILIFAGAGLEYYFVNVSSGISNRRCKYHDIHSFLILRGNNFLLGIYGIITYNVGRSRSFRVGYNLFFIS